MKKIDNFTNRYSLQKTLRFSLIPIGETEENFNAKRLLETDKKLAQDYKKVKKYIDRYYRKHIENVLSKHKLEEIKEYSELYYKVGKSKEDIKLVQDLEKRMRKSISESLKTTKDAGKVSDKKLINEILPEYLESDEELETVKSFNSFSTYFNGFNVNRKLLYSDEKKHNTIAYRCIHDNLPRFLDNAKNFKKIAEIIPKTVDKLNDDFEGICGVNVADVFDVEYFSFVLSQSGIDNYNNIIGGYSCSDSTKVQGLNEYVNEYNQTVKEKGKKIPFIKPLYKQILTISDSISFIDEKFSNDNDLIKAVNGFYAEYIASILPEIKNIFENFNEYDDKGIFISNDVALTSLSNDIFGSWSAVQEGWNKEYSHQHPLKNRNSEEKYYENMKKEYGKIESFSLFDIQRLGGLAYSGNDNYILLKDYYKNVVVEKIGLVEFAYENAKTLLNAEYKNTKKLCKNNDAIELIKTLLDNIKDLEHILKGMLGSGKEETKDDIFYGSFLPFCDTLSGIDRIYDKVRNYVTQKPYSKEKIKLNFENEMLLNGWDINKENTNRGVILKKNNKYFLAIIDKQSKIDFSDYKCKGGEEVYDKFNFKLKIQSFQNP